MSYCLEKHDATVRDDVWRIVDRADADRFANVHKTTARPPYVAVVWGYERAKIVLDALNESLRSDVACQPLNQ